MILEDQREISQMHYYEGAHAKHEFITTLLSTMKFLVGGC